MKKALLYNWGLNIAEYTFVYLFVAFVNWHFHNPFQWIIDLSTYQPMNRFLILFYVLFWQGLQYFIIYRALKNNTTTPSNTH